MNVALAPLFSQDCLLCGVHGDATLCAACRRTLPHRNGGGCPVCDADGAAATPCGACLAEPPYFDTTLSAFRYQFPLDRLMQAYKFSANLTLVKFFSAALSARVVSPDYVCPDFIVPMPLGKKRLAERGFNQAALLAQAIGRDLGVTVRAQDLLRVRETAPQSGLSRGERLKNVRGAFSCGHTLAGGSFALVDDVMTTGATLSEAARALKKAGAARVDAWVVARVIVNQNTNDFDAQPPAPSP